MRLLFTATLLVFVCSTAACGGKTVAEQGGSGGTGTTFACGDQTCQRDSEYCVDELPVQPPPEGDGVDTFSCAPLPSACSAPSCACAGLSDACSHGFAGCSAGEDGAVTVMCSP